MATVNKKELVAVVAEKLGSTKKDGALALEAVIEAIRQEVKAGNEVNVAGFGKYSEVVVPAHERKLGFTGETIQVAEKTKLKFKASKSF